MLSKLIAWARWYCVSHKPTSVRARLDLMGSDLGKVRISRGNYRHWSDPLGDPKLTLGRSWFAKADIVNDAISTMVNFFLLREWGYSYGEHEALGKRDLKKLEKAENLNKITDHIIQELWVFIQHKDPNLHTKDKKSGLFKKFYLDKQSSKNAKILAQRAIDFFDFYDQKLKKYRFSLSKEYKYIGKGERKTVLLTDDAIWMVKSECCYLCFRRGSKMHKIFAPKRQEFSIPLNQLLVYYLIGMDTDPNVFGHIKYLAVYDAEYRSLAHFPISEIPLEVIDKFKEEVIGMN